MRIFFSNKLQIISSTANDSKKKLQFFFSPVVHPLLLEELLDVGRAPVTRPPPVHPVPVHHLVVGRRRRGQQPALIGRLVVRSAVIGRRRHGLAGFLLM